MRIWIQTVLPPVITTGLYYVIFGNLIGQRIGQMDGFDYIDFIVPGLILMAVITVTTAPMGLNVNRQKRKYTLWKPVRE